jgi:hypothetical protein
LDIILKSVKYLEQIIKKKKYEILSSIMTTLIESQLDLYNQIRTLDDQNSNKNKNENNQQKLNIISYMNNVQNLKMNLNESLAALVKWSDAFLLGSKDNNLKQFQNVNKIF